MQPGSQNPACLFPGTRVGPWRIVRACGCGSHGAVYLAEGVEAEATGLVALKLALFPRDARFGREAALLSRVCHPCIPRLIAQGEWQSPAGPAHPYLAMEWVDGMPLYAWARECRPSSRQVLRVLADVARALDAVHAAEAVHRDVKGDNVLVRRADDRGFLMDFGSCNYRGSTALTLDAFPPDTRAYRSPEAFQFERDVGETSARTYVAGPADDLFALGVTAWVLVTRQYPSRDGEAPGAARELNPRCCEELSQLISRMLSVRPEARGTAGELAGALEQAAREAGAQADAPLFLETVHRHAIIKGNPRRLPPRARRRWWLAAAVVAMGATGMLSTVGRETSKRDVGTVAVGDSALTTPEEFPHEPSAWKPVAENVPSKPLPGQLRPDASGRCPYKHQIPINGGCWLRVEAELKECREHSYLYKGACYQPIIIKHLPPGTSNPAESPDGGIHFDLPPP